MDLNKAVIEYQETRDDYAFSKIYEYVHKNGRLVDALAKRYNIDSHDVESAVNMKLLEAVEKFQAAKGDFINFARRLIRRACIDLSRSKTAEDDFLTDVMIEDEETGDLNEIYETIRVAPTTTEEDIVNEVRMRRDQRQLIAYLLEKADEPTKLSISAFLNSESYRQAAKLVGTCHKTVQARIRRLSRNFCRSLFGSPSDFFTVPTVSTG